MSYRGKDLVSKIISIDLSTRKVIYYWFQKKWRSSSYAEVDDAAATHPNRASGTLITPQRFYLLTRTHTPQTRGHTYVQHTLRIRIRTHPSIDVGWWGMYGAVRQERQYRSLHNISTVIGRELSGAPTGRGTESWRCNVKKEAFMQLHRPSFDPYKREMEMSSGEMEVMNS